MDWPALAKSADTLVILMGLGNLPQIVQALRDGGLPHDRPVALIQQGAGPRQRTVVGTLDTIAEQAENANLEPPVVAVVGEVVGLRKRIAWCDTRPLFGKRVLVTRTRQQAGTLAEMLAERGAEPVEIPAIAIETIPDNKALTAAIDRLAIYQWLVFSSANGVAVFFDHLDATGLDSRALAGVRVCAIGPATAAALAQRGVRADMVPEQYVAESLVEALRNEGVEGKRILLARAEMGRDALRVGLEAAGAQVDEAPLYRALTPSGSRDKARALLAEGMDIVTFTSSSTVRNLIDLLDGDVSALQGATIACIGPITASTAREMGLTVHAQAAEYTIPGLVQALVDHFERGGG